MIEKAQSYRMRVLFDGGEAVCIDTVSVHSSTGSADETRRHKAKGIYWPRNLVSKDVPYLIKPWMPRSLTCGWTLSSINLHNIVKEINVLLSDVSGRSRQGEWSIIVFKLK